MVFLGSKARQSTLIVRRLQRLCLYCFQLVAEKPLNEERMEGKTSVAVSQTTRLLRLRSALP
jgi:hypothetical protein